MNSADVAEIPKDSRRLKMIATSELRGIFVVAKIHTPPSKLSPAHTENMMKNT